MSSPSSALLRVAYIWLIKQRKAFILGDQAVSITNFFKGKICLRLALAIGHNYLRHCECNENPAKALTFTY